MGKVDLNRYGGLAGAKMVPEDLDEDIAILTISEFGEQKNPEGISPVLRFQEAPDRLLYINRTQVEFLVKKLGDDSDNWIGRKIPVEKKEVEYNGKMFLKVYVMEPQDWDKTLRAATAPAPGKVSTTAPPAARGKRS